MRRNERQSKRINPACAPNPKISVGGLGNRVGCPTKTSILCPPCRVPILRDLLLVSSAPTGLMVKKIKNKAEQSSLEWLASLSSKRDLPSVLTRFHVEPVSRLFA